MVTSISKIGAFRFHGFCVCGTAFGHRILESTETRHVGPLQPRFEVSFLIAVVAAIAIVLFIVVVSILMVARCDFPCVG